MQRTDITEIFPEATKEQVEAMMALYGADVNKAKSGTEQLTSQLKEAQEALAKALTENHSTALGEAQSRLKELQAELDGMKAADGLRLTREKVAKEKNVPAHLLTGETEESCAAQADAILAFAKPAAYPSVKDAGEPAGKGSPSTRDQFANWAKENF